MQAQLPHTAQMLPRRRRCGLPSLLYLLHFLCPHLFPFVALQGDTVLLQGEAGYEAGQGLGPLPVPTTEHILNQQDNEIGRLYICFFIKHSLLSLKRLPRAI